MYYLTRNGYYGTWKGDSFVEIGIAVYLIAIQINIENCDITFTLETTYMNETIYVSIPRADVYNKYKLISYSAKGIDVLDSTANCLANAIREQEEAFDINKVEYVHTDLGWLQDKNPLIFRRSSMPYKKVYSTYKGALSITPNGEYGVWKKMVEDYVVPSAPLTFALAVAMAAVINGLSDKLCDGETLFTHFVGGSSTGKTTAAMLAISAAGEPNLSGNSLMKSWSSTKNAVIASLTGNYGYPIVFDELSLLHGDDHSQLIYNITAGRDKTRMTKELSLVYQKGYRTAIISTGEKSILQNCNGNGGISVRVIEIANITFTESAEAAEHIKEVCRNNYGWAIEKFTERLCKFLSEENALNNLFSKFTYYREKFLKVCVSQHEFTDRLSKKYALILLSCNLIKEFLHIPLKVNNLLDFIVEIDKVNNLLHPRDIAEEFMEKLSQYIVNNENKFLSNDNYNIQNCIGRIKKDETNSITEVIVLQDKFDSIVRDLHFEDVTIVVNKLKVEGYLSHDSDRNTRKVKILGSVSRCYVIKYSLWQQRNSNEIIEQPPEDEVCSNTGFHDYDDI